MTVPTSILTAFGFNPAVSIIPFGTGLINHTWKVTNGSSSFILQRLNVDVFKTPWDIAENIDEIGGFLKNANPDYLFITPVPTGRGSLLAETPEGVFRLSPFVNGSISHDVLETPAMAREAAKQFGRFTRLLDGFDAERLKITLPSFHNLHLRFDQFQAALENGDRQRIDNAKELIENLLSHADIVETYNEIVRNKLIKLRVGAEAERVVIAVLRPADLSPA